MRVLGIDTATAVGALGIIDGSHTVYEKSMLVRPGGAERFPSLIQQALREIGWVPKNIDLIAVGQGPGSYTGVRVGMTIAKGMAYSLSVPLVSVSTLYVLAANAATRPGLICPMLESRREEVYAALYFRQETSVTEVLPPGAWLAKEFCADLRKKMKDTPILFLGEGAVAYRELILNLLGAQAVFGEDEENLINGATLARLALAYWEETGEDALYSCQPLYLKRTEAEVRWAEQGRGL